MYSAVTPIVVKVPLTDVEKHMKSKAEIYNFLVTEWQAFLPDYRDCSPGTALSPIPPIPWSRDSSLTLL